MTLTCGFAPSLRKWWISRSAYERLETEDITHLRTLLQFLYYMYHPQPAAQPSRHIIPIPLRLCIKKCSKCIAEGILSTRYSEDSLTSIGRERNIKTRLTAMESGEKIFSVTNCLFKANSLKQAKWAEGVIAFRKVAGGVLSLRFSDVRKAFPEIHHLRRLGANPLVSVISRS